MNILGTPHWYKFSDILKHTRNIEGAVYAFAVCDKVPDDYTLPQDIENTVYIGQSGGSEENTNFDQKDKNTGRGRFESTFHRRMKSHRTGFNGWENTDNLANYKLFHETYGYGDEIFKGTLDGNFLCVCLLTIPKNIEAFNTKAWLFMVESCMIYEYQTKFKKPVLMNFAHRIDNNNKRKNENSISQQRVREIRKQNLFEIGI